MGLKDIFWKDNGPKESPREPSKKITSYVPSTPSSASIRTVGAPQANIDITSAGEFDKYFLGIMDQANLPGPDYFEFAKALEGLKNAGLPEEQKLLAVFAGFQAQGVTPQSLVDAANKYIDILNSKKTGEFDASVVAAQNVILGKEQRIDALVKENAEIAAKLQKNNEEVQFLTQERVNLLGKLESKKTTFNMSFSNFIQKIQKDIESIQKYLINGNITK